MNVQVICHNQQMFQTFGTYVQILMTTQFPYPAAPTILRSSSLSGNSQHDKHFRIGAGGLFEWRCMFSVVEDIHWFLCNPRC